MEKERYYMRAKEIAKYYGVGLSTVWLYAKQGKLTPKRVSPRVTVFDVAEVEALFKCDEVA